MDYMNLVYNGDFTEGTRCWRGTDLSVSNNTVTVTGDLYHSQTIPVSSNDTYRISLDIKFNTIVDPNFYISLRPLDSDKNLITSASSNRSSTSATATNTTLAKDLNNGDTIVELTDGTGWDTTHAYQRIGICDNIAWGYNRNSVNAVYASRDVNKITLKAAWTQGSFPAGTKVANFRSGSSYFYPIAFKVSDASTEWKSYSATFKGGNSMRYSCQYFIFSTLGYTNNYSIRNVWIENTTSIQTCDITDLTPQIYKSGNITGIVNERGRKIRYIKDSINGSTSNTANHWVEIQAYNNVGENIAFNKNFWSSNNTTKRKGYLTDGSTSTNPYDAGGTYRIVDLGFVEQINSIKIWHYWYDGRTYYDNIVEVSSDGVHWDKVYSGEHMETQSGFEIPLYPKYASFFDYGFINCGELKEI